MSADTMMAFINELAKNPEEGNEFARNVETKGRDDFEETVIAFARTRGFAITTEDIRRLNDKVSDFESYELSDDDLSHASGGTGMAVSGISIKIASWLQRKMKLAADDGFR